ncbi:hypothetical protein F5X68DRAFT_272189 [Plectosphaerella plurivora]|uniref:Uncharacterized protein n=1 Tax=Plectosphaerella plurivora TaxID=936078 RepID=A0A9P8VPB2_9PEZI|nr:hypothetical protein F5X68DRAFT_272189 [Plectosphaerella plurivora]
MRFSTLALVASSVLGQELSKPAAWPNLDVFRPMLNLIPRQALHEIVALPAGQITKGCRDRVLLDGRDPTKFSAYMIIYGDCAVPWVVCREEGAEGNLDQLAQTFARLPVGMRQWVGDVVHFKGGSGGSAWQSSILHVSGNSAYSVPVLIHEASHCVDGGNGLNMKSDSTTWRNAYNRDSHVADNYARTNHVENFAQYAGLVIYDRWTQGDLQTKVPQINQIRNQVTTMSAAADVADNMFEFLNKKSCTRRWGLTTLVNAGSGAVIAKRSAPFVVPRDTGIEIIAVPEALVEAPVTNCTIGESV